MTRLPIPHALAGALLALVSVVPARAQEKAPFRYETQHVDDYFAQRAAALAAALGFATWPSTPGLFPPPAVSRTLLRDPAAPLDEVRACTTVAFNDGAWPQCTWSWKGRSEGRKPASQDWLDLEVTTTPSSRAAREYLIGALVANQLPTEAVVQRYTSAERPANLGDVSFVVRSPKGDETSVAFLRANLVFRIRGHGALAAEALRLALRLDERLAGQSPVTLENLRARSRDPLRRR